MLLRPWLLTAMLLFGLFSFSQSVFEFDYKFVEDNIQESYKAFMVRNDDGTGFMRIRFKEPETNETVLVDMQIQEHYLGEEDPNDATKTDSTILVFEGFDPQVISGPKGMEYDPDIFIFQYSQETDNYEPVSVISVDDQNKEHEGTIADVKLLNDSDLTKELVSLYFTEEDEVFKNLFEEAIVRPVTPELKSTRLFLIIVANTDDISIGSTCAVDKDATLKTFTTLAGFLSIKLVPTVISGKDFSKINVDRAVQQVQPDKSDIVVFYYSGHGFANNSDNNKFPFLDLRDKISQNFGGAYTINIEDVFRKIKAKGARLNLVISDCCNADPSQSNIVTADVATTRHSSVGWNLQNCRALFMNEKPLSVLMTAASKGELSAGNSTGGIFTFNFRESLEKSFGPFYNLATWEQVLKMSQAQTIAKAKRTWCIQPDNSRKACVQNPVFKQE